MAHWEDSMTKSRAIFKRLIALIALAGLQACSTCYTRDMVNVRPKVLSPDFELQETQPYVTRLLVPNVLDVRLGLCGDPEPYVCVHLRVSPGQTATLTQSEFRLIRSDESVRALPFPSQKYNIVCRSEGNGPMQCPNPPEIANQPNAPRVQTTFFRTEKGAVEVWVHTVEPLKSFVGMSGSSDPPGWKLFSKYSDWREYTLRLAPAANFNGTETLLELPDIVISGRRLKIPPMTVKSVPTRLCPVYV